MSVALVTGAGQGIGRAIALGFSRRDTRVVVADVRRSNAFRVQAEIKNTGKKAFALEVDVSSEPSVTRMIERTLEEFGTIDILVNDAGIYPSTSVEDLTQELWDQVIGTNLTGTFLCSRAAVPIMLEKKKGRIINT